MVVLHARHAALSRWDAIGLAVLFGLEAYSAVFELAFEFRYGLTASLSVLVSLYCLGVCLIRFRAARRRPAD
ncbi:MAG: hypothetical protein HYY06_30635 [Deltaproteobacteria bacterium]|nr:hypothetical protein [Deltaproteobacteria bacterium]